ncbi:hypothetical protein TcWFU_001709 [Taenia crassiceps]|uniref:Transforming acidic coiled-coil-containing protein C-terminal domain-containing protein n=1 Tax=Taenia crassiceps TaxID=6207 RepID=A0ABR4QPG0_9CEST
MDDRQKLIQLTSEEIDRLLADSSISLRGADDPVVTRTSGIAPESTFTEEDLALLDDTGVFKQTSSAAIEKEHNENVLQEATQVLGSQTERIPVVADEIPPNQFKDPTISAQPADSFSLSSHDSSQMSTGANHDYPRSSTQKRNSLSKLVHGWTTLMGHPIAGSISSQLSASPQSVSIFSPLLTQSSKILTGVVSSLLSPWAVASRQIAGASEHSFDEVGLVQDRPCENSLISAFEKIGVADSRSEHDDVFFSPNRERDETKGARNASISPLPTVHLRSATMEDTQCGPNTESSVYSDAISVQPSPVHSAPENIRCLIPPSSQRPSIHLFSNSDAVSSSHMELQSDVESFAPSESGRYTSRLVNVDITPSVSPNKTIAEEGAPKITQNLLLGVGISPRREVFHRNMLSSGSEISEDTFNHMTPSHKASEGFSVDMFSQKLEAETPTKSADVHPEGPGQPATNLTPKSTSKPRVTCSPFPMMISMLNDDEEWNRTQKSADRSAVPIIPRRKSKSVTDRRKDKYKDELVSRESAELCQESSKRCEMTTFEQLSPQLSSSICPSISGSVNMESAAPLDSDRNALGSHCPVPSCPSSEHLSAVCGMSQPPLREAANSVAFTDSEQEDKENVSPHALTVTRRRATHRIPVLSVSTAPVPAPRRSAHKAKTQPSLPTDREIIEEKVHLRREIKTLKAKEDILRLVLSKYETAFEEALDQRSQVDFAAASARAQASNEASETRRQAATLYNAVLDSQRRHERMHETIEKAEANQKEWLRRVEALRTKHAHQSEKGVTYQKYCLGKIQRALENQEARTTEMERELSKLRVYSKQIEMKQRSLEAEVRQKAQENQELTRICDSLLT